MFRWQNIFTAIEDELETWLSCGHSVFVSMMQDPRTTTIQIYRTIERLKLPSILATAKIFVSRVTIWKLITAYCVEIKRFSSIRIDEQKNSLPVKCIITSKQKTTAANTISEVQTPDNKNLSYPVFPFTIVKICVKTGVNVIHWLQW